MKFICLIFLYILVVKPYLSDSTIQHFLITPQTHLSEFIRIELGHNQVGRGFILGSKVFPKSHVRFHLGSISSEHHLLFSHHGRHSVFKLAHLFNDFLVSCLKFFNHHVQVVVRSLRLQIFVDIERQVQALVLAHLNLLELILKSLLRV